MGVTEMGFLCHPEISDYPVYTMNLFIHLQINEHTPWIDGGVVYGTSKAWADKLRSFKGGRLADNGIEGEPEYPEVNKIGLPIANPPDPVEHKLQDAKRLFSTLTTYYANYDILNYCFLLNWVDQFLFNTVFP